MPNIDNNLPRDFLDELKKMPEEELNLTNKGIIPVNLITMEKENKYKYI